MTFSFPLMLWEAAQVLEDPQQAIDHISRSALECFLSVGEPDRLLMPYHVAVVSTGTSRGSKSQTK